VGAGTVGLAVCMAHAESHVRSLVLTEVRDRACFAFGSRGGDSVAGDVFDKPVHLVDLTFLRFDDRDCEFAYPYVISALSLVRMAMEW
jgi:hypothetical protein